LSDLVPDFEWQTNPGKQISLLSIMRIITRTVLILSVISLFADIASEMLYPVIPIYLREINFTVFAIGLLEGFANFTSGISKGYFGKLSDEKGVRLPFVKLGYFFSAISKPMMAVFTIPLWIFFVRFLDRLGKGVRTAARDALLSQEATPATKARVFGFHRSMDTVGATIGPVIALLFIFFYPGEYKIFFFLAFIPGLISVLLIFLLKEKKHSASTLAKGNFFSYLGYWKIASPEYKKLITGLAAFALFNSADIFLILKTQEVIGANGMNIFNVHLSAEASAIAAYVFYNLIFAIGSYPLGALADRISLKKVFLAGLCLFAIVYGGFAITTSSTVIFILFFLYGVYAAATEGIIKAWITNMAHQQNTATAVGFYESCQSICTLFASIIAGFIWNFYGSQFTFLITSAVTVLIIIYLMTALRNQKK
jgi:MFS family permease